MHGFYVNIEENRITIKGKGVISFFPLNELMYCRASGAYTELFFKNHLKQLATCNLKHVNSLLPDEFIRIHHTTLVCFSFVATYLHTAVHTIVLHNKTELNMSKRKKKNWDKYIKKQIDKGNLKR